jgi:hypothetical protein
MTSPRLNVYGKNRGGRPKGCVDSVQRKLRDDHIGGLIEVQAKCPACSRFHTVMLGPEEVEAGKVQYLYCSDHITRRTFAGDIYELPGHINPERRHAPCL